VEWAPEIPRLFLSGITAVAFSLATAAIPVGEDSSYRCGRVRLFLCHFTINQGHGPGDQQPQPPTQLRRLRRNSPLTGPLRSSFRLCGTTADTCHANPIDEKPLLLATGITAVQGRVLRLDISPQDITHL
jgi:hypothetical protein